MAEARSNLAKRAMLVTLETGSWSARTVDDDVTDEIGRQHEAEKDHGKYQKRLLSKEAVKAVNAIRQAARVYHNGITLPWQGQLRLLPVNLYESYRDTIADFAEQRIAARNELVDRLEEWKAEARERLGSMFYEADYPDAEELREAYYLRAEFTPVPDVQHFVADLADEERAEVAGQIEQQIENRIAAANRDLHRRLYELALKVNESLGKGRFSEALYNRMVDLLDVLPRLNLSHDPELDGLVAKLRAAADSVNPKEMRTANRVFDEEKRDAFVEEVTDVQARLSGYFGDPPPAPVVEAE